MTVRKADTKLNGNWFYKLDALTREYWVLQSICGVANLSGADTEEEFYQDNALTSNRGST